MQESAQNEVELKGHGDLKKDIFEPMLKYIYSGTMDVESKEKDTIMEILSEAHFFSMSELVGEILVYLKEAHKDNLIKWAFQMLQFAETHSNNKLKEECFKELEVDPDTAILDSEAMLEMSQNSFGELISRDSFWALEENILNAVLERIDKERTRDGLTSEQCAEKFRSLTGAIRLQQLSVETLEGLRESPFFTADQVLDAMFLRTSQCHLKRRDRGIEGIRGKLIITLLIGTSLMQKCFRASGRKAWASQECGDDSIAKANFLWIPNLQVATERKDFCCHIATTGDHQCCRDRCV